MLRKLVTFLNIFFGVLLVPANLLSQSFPIAVGPDTAASISAAWATGNNGIVAILGDSISPYSVTAQRVAPPSNLVGERISVGKQGLFHPGVLVASDGFKYLLVWRDSTGDVNGQLIDTLGNLVGSFFTIASGPLPDNHPDFSLCFCDTTYMVIFVGTDSVLYGQRVSRNGSLIGSQIQITQSPSRSTSVAFDGVNYLAVWVVRISGYDSDIHGQFISKNGTLVGNNFIIDNGPYLSDNPTSTAFDGNRYLVCQHEAQDTLSPWWLVGRFVTTSGTVEQTIIICDSTETPLMPFVSFDGNNYLITWTQINDRQLLGRFWTPSGDPIGQPFVIFDSIDNKIPVGGSGFGGNKFLVVGTRVDMNLSDGDVYGAFLNETGVEEGLISIPANTPHLQNYPNPFTEKTIITYNCIEPSGVIIKIYNAAGQEITTLMNRYESAGVHSVVWDAISTEPGVYFYQMIYDDKTFTRKCLLVH
ncbi:T9SS type A sorting domain-containing protein [candidate division WOR-3 bacterium]|nr:T9SS type A sorting domain-containing protein [candidate division WOR-3 bacterium]